MDQSKTFCSVDIDTEFPYKILIGANKEIELFNVRPSFVSAPPQQKDEEILSEFSITCLINFIDSFVLGTLKYAVNVELQ